MTPQERQQVLQLIGQLLIDSANNRLTKAMIVGICTEVDNNLPAAQEPPQEQKQES